MFLKHSRTAESELKNMSIHRHIAATLFLLLSHFPVGQGMAQQVTLITVRSAGDGATQAEALREAVVRAVAQVNGEALASQVRSQISSYESSSGERSTVRQSTERFESATRGVVRSHQIVSLEVDKASGLHSALIEAVIASFRPSEQLNRIRLAIVQDHQGGRGLSVSDARQGEIFSSRFENALNESLVGSRKVAILSREDAQIIQQEMRRTRAPGTAIVEQARFGNLAAPDLLLVVSLRKLAIDKPRLNASSDPSALRIAVAVNVRVLDYTSGMVKHAVTLEGARRFSSAAVDSLAVELGQEASDKLLEHAFPATVIGLSGNEITVSLGEPYFEKGDKIALFSRGSELKDPDTGESLGYSESRIGEATVVRTSTRFSVARVSADVVKLAAGQPAGTVLARRQSREFDGKPMSRLPGPAGAPKEGKDW